MSAIIYCITNTTNGKVYIGYTTKTLEWRWKQHVSCAFAKTPDGKYCYTHHFYTAIRKYDKDVWKHEVLLEESDARWAQNITERFLISHFESTNPEKGYNSTLGGDGTSPNEETRQKMSEAQKGEKSHMWGKRLSDETRQKMREAQKGEKSHMWGKRFSDETRQRLSESKKGKRHSEETRQKMSTDRKGIKQSDESRRKKSEALKRYYQQKKSLSGLAQK